MEKDLPKPVQITTEPTSVKAPTVEVPTQQVDKKSTTNYHRHGLSYFDSPAFRHRQRIRLTIALLM